MWNILFKFLSIFFFLIEKIVEWIKVEYRRFNLLDVKLRIGIRE